MLSKTMHDSDRTLFNGKRPPPIKLLSSHLRAGECKEVNGNIECTIKVGPGKSHTVRMVWMQGTVMEAQLDRDAVILLDETGTFSVHGINNIPKGKPCLSQGKYVMVMGVIQAISPEPVIRAMKMADLSENAVVHRGMWKLEVEDLQNVLF